MADDILKILRKIPLMIEFIIGAFVFLIIWVVGNEVISEVAKESVCKESNLANQFLCLYYTNPVVAFLSTVTIVIIIIVAFRKKFFK